MIEGKEFALNQVIFLLDYEHFDQEKSTKHHLLTSFFLSFFLSLFLSFHSFLSMLYSSTIAYIHNSHYLQIERKSIIKFEKEQQL